MDLLPPAVLWVSNCLNSMNNSSATTTQMADLENILFTSTPPMQQHLYRFQYSDFTRNKPTPPRSTGNIDEILSFTLLPTGHQQLCTRHRKDHAADVRPRAGISRGNSRPDCRFYPAGFFRPRPSRKISDDLSR